MSKVTYKIKKKKNEDDPDVIVRSGHKSENLFSDFIDVNKNIRRMIDESEAANRLDRAKMENVKKNHPAVDTLDREKRVAIMLYTQSEGNIQSRDKTIESLLERLKQSEEECEEIKKQTGVDILKKEDEK